MRFRVFSHIRSGTEWFAALLNLNFDLSRPETETGKGGHQQIEQVWDRLDPKSLYIVRDGRDVLTASYHYWLNGGSPHFNIGKTIRKHGISFSQFLRGETPLAEINEICIHYNHVVDPICNWINHTRWIYFAYTVRYEDLKNDLHNTMVKISEEFEKPLICKEAQTIERLIGVKPRKGIIGDHKNLFSKEDLEYFWQKAGDRMLELGYVKEG